MQGPKYYIKASLVCVCLLFLDAVHGKTQAVLHFQIMTSLSQMKGSRRKQKDRQIGEKKKKGERERLNVRYWVGR